MNLMSFMATGMQQAGVKLPPFLSVTTGAAAVQRDAFGNPVDPAETSPGDPSSVTAEIPSTSIWANRGYGERETGTEDLPPWAQQPAFSPTSQQGQQQSTSGAARKKAEANQASGELELANALNRSLNHYYEIEAQMAALDIDQSEVWIPHRYEEDTKPQVTDLGNLNIPEANELRGQTRSTFRQLGPDGKPYYAKASAGRMYLGEVMGAYYTVDGAETRRINDLLRATGVYAPDREPFGGPGSRMDPQYQTGWKNAVKDARAAGMPVINWLQQNANAYAEWRAGGGGGGGGGGARGPVRPTVKLISSEDAEALLKETSKRLMGRSLTDEEQSLIKEMTEGIRGVQRKEQNALIDQQMAGGGEADDPTRVGTLAESEVEEEYETEVTGYKIASAFTDLARMIGQ